MFVGSVNFDNIMVTDMYWLKDMTENNTFIEAKLLNEYSSSDMILSEGGVKYPLFYYRISKV